MNNIYIYTHTYIHYIHYIYIYIHVYTVYLGGELCCSFLYVQDLDVDMHLEF